MLAQASEQLIARSKRILIIDDDRAILRVLSRVLSRKGYLVATSETGKEALEKLETISYDAATIDVRLPDMEGTDLLSYMQKAMPSMVRIIFTGLPLIENSCAPVKERADAFLSKPVRPKILLSILEEKLARKSSTNCSCLVNSNKT